MTIQNRGKLWTESVTVALLTLTLLACKEESKDFAKDTSNPENNTDGSRDSENDTDTYTDSENAGGDPCGEFHAYAENCGMSGQELTYMDLMCTMMDGLFIDSFLSEMLDCFSPDSCDEFVAMLASSSDTEADAGAESDPFTICASTALVVAEPDQANIDFQEHFCAWALQCNGELTPTECALYFTNPDELLYFNVLDTPYITDADACVYPMPTCSEDVMTCLETVTNAVTETLDLLGK